MRLRQYRPGDADVIGTWVENEKTHALWCANLFSYPFDKEEFECIRRERVLKYGESSFTAVEEDGSPVGYFSIGIKEAENCAFLCFLIIDPNKRGRNNGTTMVRLAL